MTEREANLSMWQVLSLGKLVPEVGTLEDPDEGSPVHVGKKKIKLYHFDAKEGTCDSETVLSVETLFFKKAVRVYYHNHINIPYLLCYVN